VQSASFAQSLVFLTLAVMTLGLAVFTITRTNPVSAVMSLVGTFVGLAGIYASLSAHFLAIMQVAVYAGAIMVLFIFVVMILNRDEVAPVSWRGILSRGLGVVTTAWAFSFVTLLVVRAVSPAVAGGKIEGSGALAKLLGVPADVDVAFGTVKSIGHGLFTDYVFPFEAISVLLLVAIVGGLVVSRSAKQEHDAEAVADRDKAMRAQIRPSSIVGEGAAEADAAHPHAAAGHH
jgi:NADH-quinone oxidoreductase subunit J